MMRTMTRRPGGLLVLSMLLALAWPGTLLIGRRLPAREQPRPDLEARLAELKISLPPPSRPVAVYRSVVVVGNMAYLAGHIPRDEDGRILTGRLGNDVDVAHGQQAARRCALAMLASLKDELGTLNRVKRVVKVTGMVNSEPDFYEQPQVVNGCSTLLAELLGPENGVGARSAVGMSSLPANAVCEIEAIFELW